MYGLIDYLHKKENEYKFIMKKNDESGFSQMNSENESYNYNFKTGFHEFEPRCLKYLRSTFRIRKSGHK
jgi:hypothetical protein